MTGREIYEMYKKKRDDSGSAEGRYYRTLYNIMMYSDLDNKEFFELIKKAHDSNKRLSIVYPQGILTNEITASMIVMV